MSSHESKSGREKEPLSRQEIRLSDPELVSVRDLIEDPERFILQVTEGLAPVTITRHGQFVALILPMASTGLSRYVLNQKHDLAYFDSLIQEADDGSHRTASQLEADIGVHVVKDLDGA